MAQQLRREYWGPWQTRSQFAMAHASQWEYCRTGSEARLSIKELAEQVKKTLGLEAAIQLGSGDMSTSYVPDTTRAQQELGLKERITPGESIQKHFDWIVGKSQWSLAF